MKKIKLVLVVISLMLSVLDYAQNRTVSGNVISTDDGLPVIGASVFVKGTKIGTVTDLDGNFTLAVPENATVLEVAYLSMKTKEVPVESFVKVALEPDSEMLAEVVVTGMQSMDRRLFTGSTAKVDASEAKLDGMADVSRSLEGRAAGVSVQNVSGTFGTAPKIRVRGAASSSTATGWT
mgnify:FL=1